MTKKSTGRQARDLAEKNQKLAAQAAKQREADMRAEIASGNNTCWDDLNGIYGDCNALLLKHISLGRELNDKELLACVEDTSSLVLKIRSLAADLRQLTSELKEIYTQHAGKTGGVSDPDLLMQTYAIFEQYNLFRERHDSCILPTAYHILEQIQLAENKLMTKKREALAAESATNPDVITDVAFKEVDEAVAA